MRTLQINIKALVAVAILSAALSVSYAILVQAQEGPAPTEQEIAEAGIVFPVPELGGCRDKADCKNYCERPENMPACIEFAERHGLMSKEEAQFARKFKDRLEEGGPGGCRSPRECEAYCTNTSNIEECIAFAEEHGGVDKRQIEEGRKVLAYVKAGGQMPGGCTSKDSCEAYCSEPDNMEECFEFAEKSGIGPGPDEDLSPEQMKKVMTLMRSGESPGGCRSKEQCEKYCEGPNNFEECISFAEKAGFVKPEEAAMARKTGGKGPGDCRSARECESYCNAPENQEACFQFAKEHGLLREEDLNQMKEGMVRMRAGLENAPPEVAACLKASLGENIINDIQAGTLTPGPAIGERARGCFERFGQQGSPKEIFEHAPPEVLSCAKEKLGEDFEKIKSGEKFPTPEMADTFRVCFEQMRFEGMGPMGPGGGEGGFGGPPPGDFLNRMPPGVASCLKTKLGDTLERIKQGITPPPPDFQEKVRACFEEFRPGMEGGFGGPPSFGGQEGPPLGDVLRQSPPEVVSCLKQKLGERLERLISGQEKPDPAVFEIQRTCFENFRPEGGVAPPSSGGGFGIQPTIPPIGSGGFDFENLPPTVFECVRRAFGENVIERLRSGSLPAAEFAAKVKSCFAEGGVLPPSGGIAPSPAVCPAMPTVDQCPAGQVKVEVFRSPECGVYYGCKPAEGDTGTYQFQPTDDPATRCAKEGGSWDSAANYCKYPQTSTQTYPSTEDPATRCAKEGGTWDSASNFCKFPPPPGGDLLGIFEPLLFFLR